MAGVCWGSNGSTQCNVPRGLSSVTAIAARCTHTAALKNDGTVVCWGYNTDGECDVPAETIIIANAAGRKKIYINDRLIAPIY
ncbi:MAG: hypothetical protein JXB88_09560 [Spirochaetales bacterium]|nr:hypothetical protein [Spirochaetales bacterium]